MDGQVVISGCSGGGKSTLLAALAARGFAVVEEPGRRIVRQELEKGGTALPWIDMAAFARRSTDLAKADLALARARGGWTFFDRGLVDAAAALLYVTGEPIPEAYGAGTGYYHRVFLTPPWPEVYEKDPERRHGLDDAIDEYNRLAAVYPALGYQVVLLPKTGVSRRADFLLEHL